MRRILLGFLTTVIVLGAFFVYPATASDVGVSSSVNSFVISDYQIDYFLTRDNENRSRLKTVERITAEFPNRDQNHGIERALPKQYDGHPTSLKIESIKQPNGNNWNYTTYESGDNLVLRIGDADRYVHGQQVYEIIYTQRDVTLAPDNARINEFYWDTNGTQWAVPILQLGVRVHVPNELALSLIGNGVCYQGVEGSREGCTISKNKTEDASVFTVQPNGSLGINENMTLAISFADGTFSPYQPTLWERITAIWGVVTLVSGVLAFGIIIWLFVRLYRLSSRSGELGTIVAEYVPPDDTSVTAASQVVNAPRSIMTAQLLDLAVRHYVKIYEVKEKSWFSPAQYEIEIIRDISDLKWEEQEILKDMFDSHVVVGSRLNLKTLQSSFGFAKRTANNDTDLNKLVRGEYGLSERRPENAKRFRRTALVLLIVGIVLLSIPFLFAALFAFIFSFMVYSLTDKGLTLKRYLEGLKMYIGVAEQERLQMLQSPEGAEKVASITKGHTEPAQLVKLYERVLPYAVLFGQEKQWADQLGAYYETAGAQPEWYSGHSAVFSAAVFSSAMSSFSTSTSTYASSSSSSSSGSGGGGASGGGGGGGGGGGW